MIFSILIPALTLFSPHAQATTLSEELRRLNKCHGLFVGERISPNHPLWIEVSNGSKNGADACMDLLKQAQLGETDKIADSSSPMESTGSKILTRFVEFYRSTFYNPEPSNKLTTEADVQDINGAAYIFVYAVFKPGIRFDSILKRNEGIRAIRFTQRTTPRIRSVKNLNQTLTFTKGSGSSLVPFSPTLVDTGVLIGLKPDDVPNITDRMETGKEAFAGSSVSMKPGSGFYADQAYLNANESKGRTPLNGATSIYRSWARSVLNDTLCIDLPGLRTSDVVNELRSSSSIPWFHGLTCLGCHITMDQLAGGIRNLSQMATSSGNDDQRILFWRSIQPVVPFDTTGNATPFPNMNADSSYFKRPPQYQLRYRNHAGELIHLSGTGLADLGQKISELDDFYVCSAKKHYQFLTGVNVNLRDPGDLMNPLQLTPDEIKFKNKVVNLGKELKLSQNAMTMIKAIISSPEFLNPIGGLK